MTFNRRKPEYTWKKPAVFAGPEHLGGGGGVTPQKSKKGGPTCGEGALACWNSEICEIKDLFAELWNFLGNVVVRNIWGTFVFGNITSTSLIF